MGHKCITNESKMLKDCLLLFFIGKRIGKGAYRHVYEMEGIDGPRVIKVEYCGKEFCNMTEWKVWKAVEHTPHAEWFAPCIDIDLMGVALIQKRTKPFDSREEFNAHVDKYHGGKLPAFFDDVHYGNFGTLDGRLVCHDYGFNHFLDEAAKMEWGDLVNITRPSRDTSESATKSSEDQLALSL